MVIINKIIALIFSISILGLSFLIRKIVGTWIFPACIFSLFWFAFTFIPLLCLFSVPVEPMSIGFILVCNVAFSLGSLPFDWKLALNRNITKSGSVNKIYNNMFLKTIFYLIMILSSIFLVLNSLIQGITIYDLIFNLFGSAAKYADLRYSEQIKINIYGQLSLVFSYLGVVIGGFLFFNADTKSRRVIIAILAFLPSAFIAITQSAKGSLPLSIVLFYAGVLICRISDNKINILEKFSIKPILFYAVPTGIILIISFITRGLYEIGDLGFVLEKLKYNFTSYSFGHIYAFSDWFSFRIGDSSFLNYNEENTSYGFYTFMALYRLFGSDKFVPIGVYEEYLKYNDLFTTNIFTMFRGLLLDFGGVGSIIYMYITGVLFHLSFYVLLFNKKPVLVVAIFVFMLGYFYSSFLISVLMWNSIYISFVLLWAILSINNLFYSYTQ